MMRLIDQPAGTGDLYENGQFRGPVHYTLNVYQQYDEGRDEAVGGVHHIEGRITPAGTIDLAVLKSRGAELLLKMADGRAIHFELRDADGTITAERTLDAM
jgi:hypothetical protein